MERETETRLVVGIENMNGALKELSRSLKDDRRDERAFLSRIIYALSGVIATLAGVLIGVQFVNGEVDITPVIAGVMGLLALIWGALVAVLKSGLHLLGRG